MITLGQTIRNARIKKQWTLRILSQNMDDEIHPEFLYEVEQDLEVPNREFLYIISKSLELELEELIDKAEEMKLQQCYKLSNKKKL